MKREAWWISLESKDSIDELLSILSFDFDEESNEVGCIHVMKGEQSVQRLGGVKRVRLFVYRYRGTGSHKTEDI